MPYGSGMETKHKTTRSCSIKDVLSLDIGESIVYPFVDFWRANSARQRAEHKTFADGSPRKFTLTSSRADFTATLTRTK